MAHNQLLMAESPINSNGNIYAHLLERAEEVLGYTGAQGLTPAEMGSRLDDIAWELVDELAAENLIWQAKKDAMLGILHIMMAALCAPSGECTHGDLGVILKKMLDDPYLTEEERRELSTAQDWRRLLDLVKAEAKARGVGNIPGLENATLLDAMDSTPSHTDEGVVPLHWYPLLPNEIVVNEHWRPPAFHTTHSVQSFTDWSHWTEELMRDLWMDEDGCNLYDGMDNEREWEERSQLVVIKIESWCANILDEATRAGAPWKTVVNAATALGGFCFILMHVDDRHLRDIRALMWYRVQERLLEYPLRVDQYFMRLVGSLLPTERVELSRAELGDGSTILERVEVLVQRGRKLKMMRELETVWRWLK